MTNPWSVGLPSLAYNGLGEGKLQAGSFWQLPTGDSASSRPWNEALESAARVWGVKTPHAAAVMNGSYNQMPSALGS